MLSTDLDVGVRVGWGRPEGAGGVVVAAVVAFYVGLLGASAGVEASGYPGPPSDETAMRVAAAAFGTQPHNVPGPVVFCDLQCPPWDGRDEIVAYDAPPDRTDRVVVLYDPPGDETAAIIARAHDRLAAAGWQIDPLWRDGNGGQQLEASHDGLNIRVDIIPGGENHSFLWSSMDIVPPSIRTLPG